MHAASGTDGFLSHTLTSRIAQLEVNRRPLAEVELFAVSRFQEYSPALIISPVRASVEYTSGLFPALETPESLSPEIIYKKTSRATAMGALELKSFIYNLEFSGSFAHDQLQQ